MTTPSKTTLLQRISVILPILALLMICLYLAVCIVGEVADKDHIGKVTDEDAHCYIYRKSISCVPTSTSHSSTSDQGLQ